MRRGGSLYGVLVIIAICLVILLTVVSLINFEVFVEWTVKAIIAAALIAVLINTMFGNRRGKQ